MDTFFIFVLLFFIAPVIFKAIKKSNSGAGSNGPWNSPEFQDLKQTLQEMSGTKTSRSASGSSADEQARRKAEYKARQRRIKVAAARQAKRLKAHEASHGDTVEKRDIHDKNRNRRADWGVRAGPGVLNTKTFITALVMGLVLAYLMAQS